MPHRDLPRHLLAFAFALCLGSSAQAQPAAQPIAPEQAQPLAPQPVDAPVGDHAAAAPESGAAQIAWHDGYQAAFDAAVKSGKPIFVFVYLPLEKSCVEMAKRTLVAKPVVEALAGFESCAVSVRDRSAKPFLDQFKLGPVRGQLGDSRLQVTPISLFIGPDGTEYLRQTGYCDPALLSTQIGRLLRILPDLATVKANPRDAVTLARIGRRYVEMAVFRLGREYLQRAVDADPDDATGAKSDATLDLAITSMDDRDDAKTVKAFQDLMEFAATHPDSPRRLEALFYMAAAQIALRNDDMAKKLLAEFTARGPNSPDAKSEWGQRAIALQFDLLSDEIGSLHRVELDSKGNVVRFERDENELHRVARAQREMVEYMKLYPDPSRRFDARYYTAVAQIKLGQQDAGERALRSLAAGGQDAPDPKGELAKAAADLLADLRAHRVQ